MKKLDMLLQLYFVELIISLVFKCFFVFLGKEDLQM